MKKRRRNEKESDACTRTCIQLIPLRVDTIFIYLYLYIYIYIIIFFLYVYIYIFLYGISRITGGCTSNILIFVYEIKSNAEKRSARDSNRHRNFEMDDDARFNLRVASRTRSTTFGGGIDQTIYPV